MSVVFEGGEETRRKAQELARYQMIVKLEADILMDMQVCDIEGWDKTEYIKQLKALLDSYDLSSTMHHTK